MREKRKKGLQSQMNGIWPNTSPHNGEDA